MLSAQKEADERFRRDIVQNKSTSTQLQQQLDAMTESMGNDEEKLREYQSLCEQLQRQKKRKPDSSLLNRMTMPSVSANRMATARALDVDVGEHSLIPNDETNINLLIPQ